MDEWYPQAANNHRMVTYDKNWTYSGIRHRSRNCCIFKSAVGPLCVGVEKPRMMPCTNRNYEQGSSGLGTHTGAVEHPPRYSSMYRSRRSDQIKRCTHAACHLGERIVAGSLRYMHVLLNLGMSLEIAICQQRRITEKQRHKPCFPNNIGLIPHSPVISRRTWGGRPWRDNLMVIDIYTTRQRWTYASHRSQRICEHACGRGMDQIGIEFNTTAYAINCNIQYITYTPYSDV